MLNNCLFTACFMDYIAITLYNWTLFGMVYWMKEVEEEKKHYMTLYVTSSLFVTVMWWYK